MTTTETPAKKPIWKKKWFWIAIAAIIVVGVIANLVDPPEKKDVPDVVGKPAAEAQAELEDAGFEVKTSGVIGDDVATFDVDSTTPAAGEQVNADDPRVTLNLVENEERAAAADAAEKEAKEKKAAEDKAAAEKSAADHAAAPLEAVEAQVFCDSYAQLQFPYGVKLHTIAGKLAEEQTAEGWYMKFEADITNEYGAERSSNIECHMSGTNGSPTMDDFLAY